MIMSLIAAVDEQFGIGKSEKLLAYIPEDLKYFKKVTKDRIVIMGKRTYDSLPIRPLRDRINIVLSKKTKKIPGAIVKGDMEDLMEFLKNVDEKEEVFIIGGAQIYEQFLEYADRIYLTHIFKTYDADKFFPKLDNSWEIKKTIGMRENIEAEIPHIFTIYEKKNKGKK